MSKARTEDTPNIKSFTLEKSYHLMMQQCAASAGTSVSAIVRDVIEGYLDEGVTMLPKEQQVRTSVWVPVELWDRFRDKAEASGVTMSDVIRSGVVRLRDTV